MKTLSVAKAADRATMAQTVFEILNAVNENAIVRILPDGSDCQGPRETRVYFESERGIAVNIDFDGDDGQNREGVWVLAWHMILNTDARMSDAFGLAAGGATGQVNPYHFRKCTTVADSFERLCDQLRRVVACIDAGKAYDLQREAANVAKNGTWQEQAARWDEYRAEMAAGQNDAAVVDCAKLSHGALVEAARNSEGL